MPYNLENALDFSGQDIFAQGIYLGMSTPSQVNGITGSGITSVGTSLAQVASPSNANASTAGVRVGQVYTTTADPHILYIRTQ